MPWRFLKKNRFCDFWFCCQPNESYSEQGCLEACVLMHKTPTLRHLAWLAWHIHVLSLPGSSARRCCRP